MDELPVLSDVWGFDSPEELELEPDEPHVDRMSTSGDRG